MFPLGLACRSGHRNLVRYLIEHGADIEQSMRLFGPYDLKAARVLLENGGKLDVSGYNKFFSEACEQGDVDTTGYFMKGAEVHTGHLLLQCESCESTEVVHLLLRSGIDMHATYGTTPLHIACRRRHRKLVDLLMQYGADPDKLDHRGKSPMMVAQELGYLEIVNRLKRQGARHTGPHHPSREQSSHTSAPLGGFGNLSMSWVV
jgi:uncharacterized protein